MGIRKTFLNVLGIETPEVQKTSNSAHKSARDFFRYGNRDKLYPTWSEIKMPDQDMYRGYSYAVIQKRGNKVASLAKENLKTWAKPEVVDEFQKKNEIPEHPYIKLISDSTKFTEKQFWKNISIYLDLAGRYYLGVVRSEIKPLDPKLPIITTDPTEFIMLNPYEIRRVIDRNGNVAGYIERKSDGRYREWPLHQIIEMRELNPFDPENSQWAMTDAAKSAVYTMNQSSDYTVQSLHGNIEAPGIITTDVLLTDEDFENFRRRVSEHTKGEPLFGNGAGAIKWDSMQIDLDKAALMDINEINRTTLFAVSGTSKTSLGIEQSGTTRETARVQSEQFVSDTAQPRLEDIVDFLNLDYKRHYNREYKKTGYYIEIKSAVGTDYATETQAVGMRQAQVQLAMQLMQSGYTLESAYQFAEGEIDLADLELEKGLDKPQSPENPGEGESPTENSPNSPNNGPMSGSGSGDDNSSTSEQNSLETANNEVQGDSISTADLNELTPHSELVENGGKGSGNFDHAGRPGERGGSAPKGTHTAPSELLDDGAEPVEKGEKSGNGIQEYKLTNGNYWDYYNPESDFWRDDRPIQGDRFTATEEDFKKWEGVGVFKELKRNNVLNYTYTNGDVVSGKGDKTYQYFSEKEKADIKFYQHPVYKGYEIAAYKNKAIYANSNGISPKDAQSIKRAIELGKQDPSIKAENLEDSPFEEKTKNSVEGENSHPLHSHEGCTCDHDHKIETYINRVGEQEGKVVNESYKTFLQEIRKIEKETVNAVATKLTVNAFAKDDLLGKKKKETLFNRLKNAIYQYWWALLPMFATNAINERNDEFGEDVTFTFTNDIQNAVGRNADKVAEGHLNTILDDILETTNNAYTEVQEQAAAELIVEAYEKTPAKFDDYFHEPPTRVEALEVVRKTDILEKNRKIYEEANRMAYDGFDRKTIIKAIRDKYKDLSEKRATLIARNETSRVFVQSQFEADKQFLNSVGKLENAYKVMYSRRPENEHDKICPYCAKLIEESNANPTPFEQPFLKFGDSIEAWDNGKLRTFTANYEDIQGGVVHPNCQCGYRLVFKNAQGEFVKTLNKEQHNDLPNESTIMGNSDSFPGDSGDTYNQPQAKSLNGGKGSGNFDHAGRPGLVGGSSKDSQGIGVSLDEVLEGRKVSSQKLDEMWSQVDDGVGEWSKKEIEDANFYYGSGYEDINRILCEKGESRPGYEEKCEKAIKTLNSRLAKSKLSQDTLVYRGVNYSNFVDENNSLPKIGDEIVYKGFSSTTLDPKQSLAWGARGKGEKGLVLAINAKKGSQAIKRFDNYEYELTLPPNAKLKVTGIKSAEKVKVWESLPVTKTMYIVECEYE